MRIKRVYIPDFLILKDFEIELSTDYDLSIIIGDNGSGKSTLLEVIAYIFGHLHKYFVLKDKTAEFIDGYEIEFISNLKGKKYLVYIKSRYVDQKTNTFKPIIKIDDEEMSISQIEKRFGDFSNFLPSRIGVYYAGEAPYLRSLSEHFEEKFVKDITRFDNPYSLNPLKLPKERPFFYIKEKYLGIVLLSLLARCSSNIDIKQFLKLFVGDYDENSIETKIILKEPEWYKNKTNNLWGIKSKFVEQFVTKLFDFSSYESTGEHNKWISYNYVGLLNLTDLFSDSDKLDFPFVVFDYLLYNDLLEDIEITFKLTNETKISSRRLSEGQRQFIVTNGLTILWKDHENKLFLYDEPDVFLHPKWQREFIPFLKTNLNDSCAIITTHNPALLSDVKKEQVHLLRNGKVIEKYFNTLGKKIDNILIDYFDLEDTRNKEVSELFKSLYERINKKDFNSSSFKEDIEKLKHIVGNDDLEFTMLSLQFKKANEKNK
ncbi:hypothetical protein CAPN010_04850 [Capnocytophaga cynodegmi]|uniref:AAA family ATPase n=1 Tax=Capnocytophaga TaxID=1016 RepID=UPI001EE23B07|nr:AAA family ATPase [Capnocytophaga cynodegmi]GJQ06327.1 hypothetical protein CAPN010_04850 [Capnocytophaga cynodegmi]